MIEIIGRYRTLTDGKRMMMSFDSMKVQLYMEKEIGNRAQVAEQKNSERSL
jgi:hypothetical protein